jgi:hypothetical protein
MRKAIASLIMIMTITAYAGGVAMMSGWIATFPDWGQLVFYVIAGVAWVFPLKPVIDWMRKGEPPPEEH